MILNIGYMKKLFVLAAVLMFSCAALCAQDYQMMPNQGKNMIYKVVSSAMGNEIVMYVTQKVQEADASSVTLAMTASSTERGQGQTSSIKYNIEGGNYVISLQDALAENLAQFGGNFEIIESSGMLGYPIALTPETEMEGAKMKIKVSMQGMELVMDLAIQDRKAAGEESITTPAGTFECLKFTENQTVTVMGQQQVTNITYWYGKGVGLVKQSTEAMGGMVSAELVLQKIE